MIKVHGALDGGDEVIAAKRIAEMAEKAMPGIANNNLVNLHIIPSAQIFSSHTRDVDILLIFFDRREKGVFISSTGREVRSFITTVELKSLTPEAVIFEGEKCFIDRRNGEGKDDVSVQSEKQKYAVRSYIGRVLGRDKGFYPMPYITNLIWFPLYPKYDLPKFSGNVVGANPVWDDFLEVLALTTGSDDRHPIETQSIEIYSKYIWKDSSPKERDLMLRGQLDRIVELFTKKIQLSNLDLKRFERVSSEHINSSKKQYIGKLGTQLLTFRGRGGSGKTARLIDLAQFLYTERNKRVIILTYNNALVSDITRQFKHRRVNNEVGGAGLSINTIHSFIGSWIKCFKSELLDEEKSNEIRAESSARLKEMGGDYWDRYEPTKQALIEYISAGAITTEDVTKIKSENSTDLDWDFILIDESQDWPESERDLIYNLYSPEKVVIADGEDQLVRTSNKINWRPDNLNIESQTVTLRKSLRMKSSLCIAIRKFAEQIEYDWELEEVTEVYGGRVVLVLGNAFDDKFQKRLLATVKSEGAVPLDVLSCVPPSWVKKDENGSRYCVLARKLEEMGHLTWDGSNLVTRQDCATSMDQFRIVQYESCRGLEGWMSVNYALDEFYDFKLQNPDIPDKVRSSLLFDEKEEAERYAKKWLMIPLTRAIDTLVIHISNPESYLGSALLEMQSNYPDTVSLETL